MLSTKVSVFPEKTLLSFWEGLQPALNALQEPDRNFRKDSQNPGRCFLLTNDSGSTRYGNRQRDKALLWSLLPTKLLPVTPLANTPLANIFLPVISADFTKRHSSLYGRFANYTHNVQSAAFRAMLASLYFSIIAH